MDSIVHERSLLFFVDVPDETVKIQHARKNNGFVGVEPLFLHQIIAADKS
jgi:hypothetical protein